MFISAGSAIDRGFIEDTVIGDRVMIDNNCHFGHNVVMGEGNVFCAQTGVAGSVVIGRNNVFGAQCGVGDNVSIGDGNMFAAQALPRISGMAMMGGFLPCQCRISGVRLPLFVVVEKEGSIT